jgi:SAM-dependent MidA family methyltransferase
LAADILGWMRGRRGAVFEGLKYCIVEPSARRREWQRETLKDFQQTVCWLPAVSALKAASMAPETIIFSNELLDAMPVRRFGWDAKRKKWFEWGVAVDCGKFVWSRLENSEFRIPNSELEAVLPDGYTVESSPAAERWWREAAAVLERGKLLAIDYGFTAEEQFSPSRLNGTLRAYHRHQVTEDVLAHPGEQDLTAHVNFSAIQNVGEMAGLKTEVLVSQEKFLTRIVERAWKRADVFGEWNPQRTRQLQTLTHPEHLGRPFRVLIQSR